MRPKESHRQVAIIHPSSAIQLTLCCAELKRKDQSQPELHGHFCTLAPPQNF